MRFWDASAIVPLLYDEPASEPVEATYRADPELVVWWATRVECVSALTRRRRQGEVRQPEFERAAAQLDELSEQWIEVEPVESVRRAALRLLRVHPLRAADALQLAAAWAAADEDPATMEVVVLDERLAEVAALEGFRVLSG